MSNHGGAAGRARKGKRMVVAEAVARSQPYPPPTRGYLLIERCVLSCGHVADRERGPSGDWVRFQFCYECAKLEDAKEKARAKYTALRKGEDL